MSSSVSVVLRCSVCGRRDEFPWSQDLDAPDYAGYANVFDGSVTLDGGVAAAGWDVDAEGKVRCPDHPRES